MASKYIGQVKDVNGFTLTVIDVEKQRFMVEINEPGTDFTEIEIVSRGAWVRGVFSKIMKRLKPAHVGETQVINGILFTIIEYAKGKFTAVAEGFEGVVKRGYDSWKKASFYNTAIRRKEIIKKVVTTAQEKVKKLLLLPAPKEVDYIEILRTTYKLKELKNAYRIVSKKFHPDNLLTGDVQTFKLADSIYKTRKKVIEDTIETFGEDDKDFKEIVDMFEEAAKEMNDINY